MRYALLEKYRDGLMLTARVLLVVLFVKFGLAKAVAFAETSAYMASTDLPVPSRMSLIAVAIELGVGLAIAIGFSTRPLALLLGIRSEEHTSELPSLLRISYTVLCLKTT